MNIPIILASQSPRRQQLLKDAGYTFNVLPANIEEVFPDNLPLDKVPEFIATNKANAIADQYKNSIVIAADTVVILENNIIGKPKGIEEATSTLLKLSGKIHKVITGVAIKYLDHLVQFSDTTKVYFNTLTQDQIQYYINHYKPFDKAGAYAIQEWIGLVGIYKIEGDYYNVMGLPINKVALKINELSKK